MKYVALVAVFALLVAGACIGMSDDSEADDSPHYSYINIRVLVNGYSYEKGEILKWGNYIMQEQIVYKTGLGPGKTYEGMVFDHWEYGTFADNKIVWHNLDLIDGKAIYLPDIATGYQNVSTGSVTLNAVYIVPEETADGNPSILLLLALCIAVLVAISLIFCRHKVRS